MESEYFAFENSLKEALKLNKLGRTDILKLLVEIIPTSVPEPMYAYGASKIQTTKLWQDCLADLKSPEDSKLP